jgi:hypothetical protein
MRKRDESKTRSEEKPVRPPPLAPDFPDTPQNPPSDLQPAPDPKDRPDKVAGARGSDGGSPDEAK